MTCPICGGLFLDDFRTSRLSVQRCRDCDHRVASFVDALPSHLDYHEHYDQNNFLVSLAATRLRQAELIIKDLKTLGMPMDGWFDIGAGRGWFISSLLKNGVRDVAGGDGSDVSVRAIRALGAVGIRCVIENQNIRMDVQNLPFAVRTVSMLDVIEHFPSASMPAMVRQILDYFPAADHVVIKVPVSTGLIYRVARFLRRVGVVRFIEQLYQVDTTVPHFNYFSTQSLELLMRKLGLSVVKIRDDVEIDNMAGRLQAQGVVKAMVEMGGKVAERIALVVGCDSRIVIAERPR